MDKETLSNYGWIVVCVMVLAVLLALASPFGTFVAGAIKSTTAGLFNVNQAALGSAGIDIDDLVFENCDHLETEVRNATDTYTGDTVCLECGKTLLAGEKIRFAHDGDVVPDGGKYTAADGTVYNPGDSLPETVTVGDRYEYGDYRYNYMSGTYNGWNVQLRVEKTKTSYSEILISINGKPITSLDRTFYNCTNLLVAPEIPENVVFMEGTFWQCYSLTTAPIIPASVTMMPSAFSKCTSLTGTIIFNTNGIKDKTSITTTTGIYCFEDVDFESQNITLTGEASNNVLDLVGTTGIHYCTECNGKCNDIQNHVRYINKHIGGTATCQGRAVCTICEQAYGNLPSCTGGTATCTEKAICQWCKKEYGNLVAHTGGTATCQNKAVCSTCGNEYGLLLSHNVHNGTCSTCGATGLIIESAHSPYANNQNNVVLGTWDYSGAQSVTITITYQTESTNYDWVYLKSGENYIDLNGNITSAETRIGGSTKTTKTFTTSALTGSVIFRTDSSQNNYYGVSVTVTPNY